MAKLKCDCGRDISYKKRRGMFFLMLFVFVPGMLAGLVLGPGYSNIIPSQERAIPYIKKFFHKDIISSKQELSEKFDSLTKNISTTTNKNTNTNNTKEGVPKTKISVKPHENTPVSKQDNSNIIGTWENSKKNRSFEFEKSGKGISSFDRDHGNHSYLYSKNFTWKQKGEKIQVLYTLESTFRDGNEFVREKDLATKATYQISNNQLIADGEIFYRKEL